MPRCSPLGSGERGTCISGDRRIHPPTTLSHTRSHATLFARSTTVITPLFHLMCPLNETNDHNLLSDIGNVRAYFDVVLHNKYFVKRNDINIVGKKREKQKSLFLPKVVNDPYSAIFSLLTFVNICVRNVLRERLRDKNDVKKKIKNNKKNRTTAIAAMAITTTKTTTTMTTTTITTTTKKI